eukprot:GHVH01004829.1.p1 GENE.GHVH01004829.1~~GHVH01004829.1.p1  ORF type:complete len:827 (-),score=130.97 GHVH01004829.1:14-2494(-)
MVTIATAADDVSASILKQPHQIDSTATSSISAVDPTLSTFDTTGGKTHIKPNVRPSSPVSITSINLESNEAAVLRVNDDGLQEQQQPVEQENQQYGGLGKSAYKSIAGSVKAGRESASWLASALSRRAKVEQNYAKELSAISDSLVICDSDCASTTESIVAYKQYLDRLSASHLELSENLSEGVTSTLSKTVLNHRQVFTSIQKDQDDILAKSHDIDLATEELVSGFADEANHLKASLASCLSLHPFFQIHEHKSQLSAFLNESVDIKASQESASTRLESFDRIRQSHLSQHQYILRSLEDMDRKRITCVKDSLDKCLIFELSSLRNCLYEAEKIKPSIDSIDVADELHRTSLLAKSHIQEGEESEDVSSHSEGSTPLNWTTTRSLHSKRKSSISSSGTFADVVSKMVASKTSLLMPIMKDVGSMFSGITSGLQTASANSSNAVISSANLSEIAANYESGGFDENESVDSDTTLVLPDIDDLFERLAKEGVTPSVITGVQDHVDRYTRILTALAASDLSVLTLDCGESLKDELSSSIFRGILLQALDRLIDNTEGKIESILGLRAITKVVTWSLDWASSQNDPDFAQWLIGNVMKFTALGFEEDNPEAKGWHWPKNEVQHSRMKARLENHESKKAKATASGETLVVWSMHRGIYNHPLLSRVAFWEKTLTALLGGYQVLEFLEQWWATDPQRYPDDVTERYRFLYHLKVFPGLSLTLDNFPSIMQSYGILDLQIEHMIMKLSVKYCISPELIHTMYQNFSKLGSKVSALEDTTEAEMDDHPKSKPHSEEEGHFSRSTESIEPKGGDESHHEADATPVAMNYEDSIL